MAQMKGKTKSSVTEWEGLISVLQGLTRWQLKEKRCSSVYWSWNGRSCNASQRGGGQTGCDQVDRCRWWCCTPSTQTPPPGRCSVPFTQLRKCHCSATLLGKSWCSRPWSICEEWSAQSLCQPEIQHWRGKRLVEMADTHVHALSKWNPMTKTLLHSATTGTFKCKQNYFRGSFFQETSMEDGSFGVNKESDPGVSLVYNISVNFSEKNNNLDPEKAYWIWFNLSTFQVKSNTLFGATKSQ